MESYTKIIHNLFHEYKESIPNKLYKYIGINNHFEENLKHWKSSNVYVPVAHQLNDIYETKGTYYDSIKLKRSGISNEDLQILDSFPQFCQKILSLSATGFSELLWGYYSNQNGICMEFDVIDKEKIFPVIYVNEEKIDVTNYIIKSLNERIDSVFQDIFAKLNYCIKHKVWGHENEFRVIIQNDQWRETNYSGGLVSINALGLKLSKIILGQNFDINTYADQIKELQDIHGCQIEVIRKDDKYFKLTGKPVIGYIKK